MELHGRTALRFAALLLLGVLASAARGQDPPGPVTLPDPDAPLFHDTPVWGLAEFRGYALGEQVAPNGLEFKPLFNLELDFNFWLWRSERVYAFTDDVFWGQRAAPGVTNPRQGAFDFSKREFDFAIGAAWNYFGPWEARAFAYSDNNLNRGESTWQPTGYTDGFGLENRYYLSDVYASLGTEGFDEARATFFSVGYFPTKNLVDGNGLSFKPGPFARAYLNYDLVGEWLYVYGDGQFIATRSWTPKLLTLDVGIAARPWDFSPRLEFRLGTEDLYDLCNHELERTLYGAVRIVY